MSKQTRNSDSLPDEILVEILCRLPVKALLKCLCVCKDWYSLIKSPSFISSHLDRTQNIKTQNLFLLRLCSNTGKVRYFAHSDDPQFSRRARLHFPFQSCFRVIGSCNGLICLVNDPSAYCFIEYPITIFLWNPLVKKLVIPPKQTFSPSGAFGFGFDYRNNDYKIVYIDSRRDFLAVRVYSLSTNSWKFFYVAELKYASIKSHSVAFVNGILHWFVEKHIGNGCSRNMILGFDVSDESFHEIMLPEALSEPDTVYDTAMAFGKSLSVVATPRSLFQVNLTYISTMREYGVTESWTKPKPLVAQTDRKKSPRVLGLRENGIVLMEIDEGSIVSYDLNCNEFRDLGIRGRPRNFYLCDYMESLVLLDKGTGLSGMGNILDCWNADDSSDTSASCFVDVISIHSSGEESVGFGEDTPSIDNSSDEVSKDVTDADLSKEATNEASGSAGDHPINPSCNI